jgi:hypothetical protein
VGTAFSGSAYADNPIITELYTADPAALVHGGTLYVYTGHDEAPPGGNNFVMNDWQLLSTTDADNWTQHGSPLSLGDFSWANANAWASEVEQGADGRFYWYVSVDGFTDNGWMNIGVAVGDSPTGPFTDAIGGPLISDSTPNSSGLNIDPTVFVDDDGQVYMYWGSFWAPRMVQLNENMVELDSSVVTPQGLAEFWEAPWMFKRNGTYYMAYASNANIGGDGCVTSSSFACIRYATANSPTGPWTHQGIVLDQVTSTTNHPAIIEYPEGSDEWWMVYHTADAPGGGNFRRSVAIDELLFNPDGTMQKVVQTVGGGGDPDDDNLALSATVTCSFTSSWEDCDAINDGIDPPSSNDTQNPRWGTWPEVGEHWFELSWADPVTVSSSDMYFFQDSTDGSNSGVKRPASWVIEYWDGNSWEAVPDASGYPTALDQYNATSFDEVTTTGLRAVVQTRSDADGVGALEWQVFGEDGGGGGSVDHAPSASPVCSFTSSWEDCDAVNDGIDPPSSNDTVNPRWGTWPEEGEQWADLRWSPPVTLDRAEVYFFDDNQGIDMPASWELQYWNGSTYVDVTNPSSYTTTADQYNTVTFNEITTSRLRVLLQSAADSVGLLEVQAWGPAS